MAGSPNVRRIAAIIFLLLAALRGYCTSVVYVITQSGIVLAADGKVSGKIWDEKQGKHVALPLSVGVKVVLLKNRTAIASDGHMRLGDYEFPKWAEDINQKISETTTLDELKAIVEREAHKTFDPLNGMCERRVRSKLLY